MNQLNTPRPCAFASANLTPVEYYRGQNALQYNILEENSGYVHTLFNGMETSVIFHSGEDASELVEVDIFSANVYIQTDDESRIGVNSILIRECDNYGRLLE